MHMLHTRRKAEIEILSATRSVPSATSLLAGSQKPNGVNELTIPEHHQSDSFSQASQAPTSTSRLIDYLYNKIAQVVEFRV